MNTMSINSENLALESHDISQQLNVPDVDFHSMGLHSVFDLIDNRLSSGFDTQDLFHLDDVICLGLGEIDTRGVHYVSEAVAFNKELVLGLIALLFVDDCSVDCWNTLHDDHREHLFQGLHHEIHLFTTCIIGIDVELLRVLAVDVLRLELNLSRFQNGFSDLVNGKLNFESLDDF